MEVLLEAASIVLLQASVCPPRRAVATPVLIARRGPIAARGHISRGLWPVLGSRAVDGET